ncbi:MAG: hypothetical protein ACO1NW_03680 [Chitinophagaceae bacterium]
MRNVILTDTGFWLGLLDPGDQFHEHSLAIMELISAGKIMMPWPCVYETISTRLVRRKKQLILLKELMRINEVLVVDDSGYREGALKEVFSDQFNNTKSLSLADIVIRKMMEDASLRINFLATFNQPDFEDVCRKRMVEILC